MISAKDFYNVMAAVVPLYVAMLLAYGSVRWWRILTPDQCGGINRFVALFAVPLLSFQIISKNNPYTMNLKFIAADSIQKAVVILVLVIWARYSSRASFEWVITHFMVATLPNTLVMGIPLLDAMYGKEHGSLVVQAVVLQCIVWYTLLLFMYEYRSARILIMEQFPDTAASIVSFKVDSDVVSLDGREQAVLTEAEVGEDGRIHVKVRKSTSSAASARYSSASVHHFGFGQFDLNSGNKSMFSSKAGTPRPSNLTGAEIYSLHSSRNITPRDSSFSRGDAYLMNMNFNVANSTQIHTALNKTESNQSNNILGAYSPSGMHLPRKVNSNNNNNAGLPSHHYHPPRTSDYDAKELHMFVWSSSASPTSDRVFGGTDGDNKETKLVVVADESQMDDSKERVSEYAQHQEFSFGDVPGYTPTDKLQGSSTVELAPKLADNTGAANDRGGNYKMPPATVMTKLILDMVWRKLLRNPNTYSSIIGLVWALVSFRWHLKAPKIIEKSITILSDAGLGMAMFSLGLFMALQPRILACGTSMAVIGMVLRFFCSPAIMSMSSIAVGLRKLDLRASIVQAALPQGIVPFVFAKEYNVHPDVLSTAVIFGMLVALPITLVYYVLLGI